MTESSKVAWVTGASSGIGLAVAQELARLGYLVVLSGRGEDGLRDAVADFGAAGLRADAEAVDVTDAAAVKHAVASIIERHGRIDVLVANAGANVGVRAWGEVTAENFDQLVRLNVNGVFYSANAALPQMRAQGGGVVIVVASWAGVHVGAKPGPAYTASKHAAVALAESLNHAEYANGIRACAICPGEVATPAMARRQSPPSEEAMKRMLQPEDIARAVGFIADSPSHVTINQLILSPTWNGAYGAPANPPR